MYERIYATVRQIPPGTVASYGQVAKAAGLYRGAQVVGWALRQLPAGTEVPWQRVINQQRRISIVNPKFPKALQVALLEAEGREVVEREGWYVVTGDDWYQFSEVP